MLVGVGGCGLVLVGVYVIIWLGVGGCGWVWMGECYNMAGCG